MADIDDTTKEAKPGRDSGGGLNEAALAGRGEEDPGGAGGGSGGGTMAGAGEPSGGLLSGAGGTTAGLIDDNIAAEAAALGPADGSLSDAEGGAARATGAEALGDRVGRATTGSGTPRDRGETGGGGGLGQGGGTGPAGAASPGGDSRR